VSRRAVVCAGPLGPQIPDEESADTPDAAYRRIEGIEIAWGGGVTEAGDDRYEHKHGPRQPEEGIELHAGPSRTGHGAIGDAPSAHTT